MPRHTFVLIAIISFFGGVTIVLLLLQANYNRIHEQWISGVRGLEHTYEASLLLAQQRDIVAASVYTPLNRKAFLTASTAFQRNVDLASVQHRTEDTVEVQRIESAEVRFTDAVLNLPVSPCTLPDVGSALAFICPRLLIEAHGGKIWTDRTPGHGTTISFSLPRNNTVKRLIERAT